MINVRRKNTFSRLPLLLSLATVAATLSTVPAKARVYPAVEVRGAAFIPEQDIRMTCGVEAGVDYLDLELRAIEDCLMSTGVFEAVSLYPDGDTLVIDVIELDTRPGRAEGTLAYASQDGVIASLSFERYNLLPKTYGAVRFDLNEEVRRFDGRLYRADAFGEQVDLGFDIIGERAEYDDRSYAQEGLRAEPFLAWTPNEHARLEAGIGYRDHRMYDVKADASALLAREQTDGIAAPYLRLGARYTSADEDGALGYRVRFDQYFWNLFSDDPLSDTRLDIEAQLALTPRTYLLLGVNGGVLTGLAGNDTRAVDRYFPGADAFRGFAPRGTGPRDRGDALGGNRFLVASLEVQREFTEPFPRPVRGGVFMDVGSAWGLDDTLGGGIDDSWRTRSSIGVSIAFDLGETPVSLYVARPLRSQPGDDWQAIGLSISASF